MIERDFPIVVLVGGIALVGLIFLAVTGCGKETATTEPWVQYLNPETIQVQVPITQDTEVKCPSGMVAEGATMRFFQNGAPKLLEIICREVRVKLKKEAVQ